MTTTSYANVPMMTRGLGALLQKNTVKTGLFRVGAAPGGTSQDAGGGMSEGPGPGTPMPDQPGGLSEVAPGSPMPSGTAAYSNPANYYGPPPPVAPPPPAYVAPAYTPPPSRPAYRPPPPPAPAPAPPSLLARFPMPSLPVLAGAGAGLVGIVTAAWILLRGKKGHAR